MNRNYILKQISHYRNTAYQQGKDDALYRIATHADLIRPGEDINTSNRTRILLWLRQNFPGDMNGGDSAA